MLWLWLNIPLAAVFVAAWTGIPLWMVLKHPDTGRAPTARVSAQAAGPEPVTAGPEPVTAGHGRHRVGGTALAATGS